MDSSKSLLTQLIDDYILWFIAWHRFACGRANTTPVTPPARFAAWRTEAIQSLAAEQPAIERVSTLHEQLHTLVKLILLKAPAGNALEAADSDSITAKYLELIQELRRFERAFAVAASDLDPLTGLRTRHGVQADLQREISRATRSKRPFFVAMMDIDHFKKINDTYGHDGGDRVLAAVADHISRGLRAHDDAYRMGGEEFLLCLKETDAAGCLQVVERLRAGLEAATITLADGRSVKVTASFGIATCTAPTKADELLRQADEALYSAKRAGRNRIVTANEGLAP